MSLLFNIVHQVLKTTSKLKMPYSRLIIGYILLNWSEMLVAISIAKDFLLLMWWLGLNEFYNSQVSVFRSYCWHFLGSINKIFFYHHCLIAWHALYKCTCKYLFRTLNFPYRIPHFWKNIICNIISFFLEWTQQFIQVIRKEIMHNWVP